MIYDVAIAGGGPAGLAFAAGAAQRGLNVVLFDRQKLPADKACGEGLMPGGLRALEELGARALISPRDCAPFRGIRYVQEDGTSVEGALPGGGGLGIRRTALASALLQRAAQAGVEIRDQQAVRGHERHAGHVTLTTDRERISARLLVAADGLHSPLRRAEGLDGTAHPVRRFGLRRHFRRSPWSDCVEVHFAQGLEAYVTPCGPERVGIAFLWEPRAISERASFDALLARFPAIAEHVRDAEFDSTASGAGPLWQRTRGLTRDRFVLLGDAAGYVDALTGEGLSLAFDSALVLARIAPEAIARDATSASLAEYVTHAHASFARYERLTTWMLRLARRPTLRRAAIGALRRAPRAFEMLMAQALG